MRIKRYTFAMLNLGLVFSSAVAADLLTFEDVTPDAFTREGGEYGGLTWSNFGLQLVGDPNSGYELGAVSGTSTVFNRGGGSAEISRTDYFDFNSAYLTAAWRTGLNITITAYRDGVLRYEQTVVVGSRAPTHVVLNFLFVDRVTFSSFGGVDDGIGQGEGTHFVMDDVEIDLSGAGGFPVGLTLIAPEGLFALVVAICVIGARLFRYQTAS